MTGEPRLGWPLNSTRPYSAISTGCEGPASGRFSIAIMQTAVQAIMIVAAAKT